MIHRLNDEERFLETATAEQVETYLAVRQGAQTPDSTITGLSTHYLNSIAHILGYAELFLEGSETRSFEEYYIAEIGPICDPVRTSLPEPLCLDYFEYFGYTSGGNPRKDIEGDRNMMKLQETLATFERGLREPERAKGNENRETISKLVNIINAYPRHKNEQALTQAAKAIQFIVQPRKAATNARVREIINGKPE